MKRAVAFDVGSHTIGIARSDLMRMFAHPVQTLRVQENEWDEAMATMNELLTLSEIDTYIVGLPITLKNNESESTLRAKRFYEALEANLTAQKIDKNTYEILFFDERFSTKSAESLLVAADMKRKKRKNIVDTVAAVIILNNYLASEKMKGKKDYDG